MLEIESNRRCTPVNLRATEEKDWASCRVSFDNVSKSSLEHLQKNEHTVIHIDM